MPRRTTVILEDDVYEKLVEESVKKEVRDSKGHI